MAMSSNATRMVNDEREPKIEVSYGMRNERETPP